MLTPTKPTTREIVILPKLTSAKTQYYDMSDEDTAYIYDWLIRFLADLTELATHDEELKKEWFRRQPRVYPKGQKGPNSTASMIGGIISARLANPKHNLSEPQLEPLESIFDMIATLYSDTDNPPVGIVFRKSLFT